MARTSVASSDSESYTEPTCFQRMDRYFWPYDATDRLTASIFTHKVVLFAYRLAVLFGLLSLLFFLLRDRGSRALAYPETWGCVTATGLYFLLCVNYLWGRWWKVAHFLYELSWCVELSCLLVYWLFLYPLGRDVSAWYDACLHGGIAVLLFLDYLNNTIYFYRRHLRAILLICSLYILLNVPISLAVYSAYRELSYANGWSALGVFLELLFLILAFLAGAQMDKFKYRFMQRPIDDPLVDFDESNYSMNKAEMGVVK